MIRFTKRVESVEHPDHTVTLPFDQRIRGRLKVTLDDGTAGGLFLDRGPILRHGDCVESDQGVTAEVRSAAETVSTVHCDDLLLLSRVCYHLGNRHTPLQIGTGMVRYQHDHVLDEMVRGLGVEPVCEQAPFEPEPGAYGEHHTDHAHGHGHSHSHGSTSGNHHVH